MVSFKAQQNGKALPEPVTNKGMHSAGFSACMRASSTPPAHGHLSHTLNNLAFSLNSILQGSLQSTPPPSWDPMRHARSRALVSAHHNSHLHAPLWLFVSACA